MVDGIIMFLFLALAFYAGKRIGFRRGHFEAEMHCQRSFIDKLRFTKHMLDQMLRDSMVHSPEEVELVLNGEIIVKGTLQDAAKKSVELDTLIKTIDVVVPA